MRRVLSVTEPAGRVSLKALPSGGGTVAEAPGHLTILSANLWHDWPFHRRLPERLERLARLVEAEGVDVVLLQEVARTRHLRSDEWLAGRLGMACAYCRANGHRAGIGFEEGVGLLSRFPLRAPLVRVLGPAAGPFVRRLALGAMLKTPFGPILTFSVHLGLRARRNAAQVAHLQRWVAQVAGERMALIGGDFNAPERSPRIRRVQETWVDTFRHLYPEEDGTTHELRWPWGRPLRRRRLDYIFLRPNGHRWSLVEARHIETPGEACSDHRPVLVRLALGREKDASDP